MIVERMGGGLGDLWDLLTGGGWGKETETSNHDSNYGSNIDGHRGRMVRMMKRSVQESKKRKCRKSIKIDRTDLVRIH